MNFALIPAMGRKWETAKDRQCVTAVGLVCGKTKGHAEEAHRRVARKAAPAMINPVRQTTIVAQACGTVNVVLAAQVSSVPLDQGGAATSIVGPAPWVPDVVAPKDLVSTDPVNTDPVNTDRNNTDRHIVVLKA